MDFPSLSEDQFHCSLCLDVFSEPVSIPCGHNFCKACIKEYWDSTDQCQCPLCRRNFKKRPEPDVNRTLRDVADHVKGLKIRNKDLFVEPGDIVCDICTERKLKAMKSCLVCQASYCEVHQQTQNSAPALKRHQLTDHVENLEEKTCKKHNRVLEFFCKMDQNCVCQLCSETDHRAHNIVPLEEECGQRKLQLRKAEITVSQMIQERLKKVKDINYTVELSKRNTKKEIYDKVQVFTNLVHYIDKCKSELIVVIEQKQEAVEKRYAGLIKELEQEVTELKRSLTGLRQLRHNGPHVQLLQGTSSWHLARFSKDWSDISVQSDQCDGYMKEAVCALEEKLRSELKRFQDEMERESKLFHEAEGIEQYVVEVTLDPDTAYSELTLSEDGKQVRCGDGSQKSSRSLNNNNRFKYIYSVLGKEDLSSQKSYYEVEVKGKTEWDLGVAKESINRKAWLPLRPEDGVWTLGLNTENCYEANDLKVQLHITKKPEKVGVLVDYEGGLVSFYDVNATDRLHICTFTCCKFTEKLYPYFHCGYPNGEKNTSPLIISPVSLMG
ncbi:hypothetical protein UPYG_G00067120 [Umbra pygmaea]|uniref:E3 ubiquitin-protein ligase TRIM39-like n=1 Tax=Umbra pygmaea TaxID=75934 RepID=A0ABD0XQI3_UMBPY